jgi:excisionase family DNA binding protein
VTPDEVRSRNFLSVKETAAFLSDGEPLDERTVRRAIAEGQIPAVRVGTKTLIPAPSLLALLAVPDAPSPVAEAPSSDAVAVVTEILRGALRALEALMATPSISAGISEFPNAEARAVRAGKGDGSSAVAGDTMSPLGGAA